MAHSPLTRWPQATTGADPRQRPVLALIHIPRSGGTTLGSIIDEKIDGRSYWLYDALFVWLSEKNQLREFLTLSPQEKKYFNALYGHMPMGVHRILLRPCAYITMLRDPLQRLISAYHQQTHLEGSYFHAAIKSGELSLDKYLREGTRNDLTRRILGFDLLDETWDWRRLEEIKASGMEMREQIERAWGKPITPALLEQAKTKLREQFMLVGVTERFSDFVFLLARELRWATIPHFRLRNRQAHLRPRVTPAPETVAQFQERNSADLELYAYAEHLFERRWSELGALEKSRARLYRNLKPPRRDTQTALIAWPKAGGNLHHYAPPVLVLIHLPKTGGTTLGSVIEKKIDGRSYWFGDAFFVWLDKENQLHAFLALPVRERKRIDSLYGHMPVGIHQILARPCAYITMLRNPLERGISIYYQEARSAGSYFHAAIKSGELTLEKYLQERPRNDMTKRILGFDLFDEAWDWQRLEEIQASGVEMREQIERAWDKPITPALLEQAKTKLREQFMLVGITERFNDFVFLLTRELGRAPTPHYQLKNRSPPRPRTPQFDPEVLAGFRACNSADLELYAYAKQLFEQRWGELGAVEKLRAYRYRWKQIRYQASGPETVAGSAGGRAGNSGQ